MDDYAQAVARVLHEKVARAKTGTARGTVTADDNEFLTFTDATGGTRKGVWVGLRPVAGDVITYLDEGHGIPVVLGTAESSPWTSYTPVWTNSVGAPTLGNGTLAGWYRREGTTLYFRGRLTIGSTTTVGSGDIRVSLPSGMTSAASSYQCFSAQWYDASVTTVNRGIGIVDPSQTWFSFQVVDTGLRALAEGTANGDDFNWTGVIEIAP